MFCCNLIESIFWFYQKILGFFGPFRNNPVYFGCFDIGSKHRNKAKQNKIIIFWFRKTNRNKPETDLVSVYFGSNRKIIFFFLRTP
jgi:hypothetical protein